MGLATVGIVITTFNHAHFLAEAIASALAQTHPAHEIIVIDDGSQDEPAEVVGRFTGVRLLRQDNQGLSAARNTGLRVLQSDMVVFLDADDRLLPDAIAAGLACHARHASCALTYGGFRFIALAGEPIGETRYSAIGADSFVDLLRINLIAMHATVMYKREVLQKAGGFDTSLPKCEDYDVYLRLARHFEIASHCTMIAEYRKHDRNMSHDHLAMLRWALAVQARHARQRNDNAVSQAWRTGRKNWRRHYAQQIFYQAAPGDGVRSRLQLWSRGFRADPGYAGRQAAHALARHLLRGRPPRLAASLRAGPPPPGAVRFGDFARVAPIDGNFGYGRGTPLDRCYIDLFLQRHHRDIGGRVLEVGDDSYSRRFGAGRITRQDVLHVKAGHEQATIIGDLAQPGVLPQGAFDCIVLTQTLHLIYDMRAAIGELHAALRLGGVLLLTVPGISQVDRHEWSGQWYWSLTPLAARRLVEDVFGPGSAEVQAYGNVFAAVAFLHGLTREELAPEKLLVDDPAYPVVVTVRAVRS